ncbi:hypothetical protein PTTG_25751 [Puccinia triticina 1-1 BBBD Race 1]|uniref:Uncharacterized protein n=2 Tax=Puccinia triticina TaxID=208348 RepID=A0A180GZR5_PUCT1|nr:uncharacterized protein PtA15_8A478 [Puccinia triticina]OAV98337.1 hypothetical protein PTTG_25751 [Puccinia triticina 1-1 BBBD Race 1]WAQ87574.1 hypothetical protein PtA15_8A478 [Puccinia triticina]
MPLPIFKKLEMGLKDVEFCHCFELAPESKNITVGQLRDGLIVLCAKQNITLLAIYVGGRQIDAGYRGWMLSMKAIPEFDKDRKFMFTTKHKTNTGIFNYIIGSAALGAISAPSLLLGFVAMLGFSKPGIIAGTPGAYFMASYKGSVAASSLCAVLQSIGAAGLTFVGTATIAGVGGLLGVGSILAWSLIGRSQPHDQQSTYACKSQDGKSPRKSFT